MSTEQPEALRLAKELVSVHQGHADEGPTTFSEAAAELRRLHAVNVELVDALELALRSHGTMLLSDPPQEAWKTYSVENKARAAIAKAKGAT